MDRPEVHSNKYQVTTKVGIGSRNEVTLTETTTSYSNDIFDTTILSPVVEKNTIAPLANIGITVQPKLEVSYTANDDHKLSVKYQFSGQGADVASAGNFSQAFSIGVSFYQDDGEFERSSETINDSPTTYTYKRSTSNWEQDTYAIDLAWILGYRFIDNMMIYGGPFLIYGDLSGQQTYQLSVADNLQFDDATIEEDVISLNSNGRMIGTNLAIEYKFDFGLFVTAEYSIGSLKWGSDKGTNSGAGLAIGYQF
jgi:hypothetical protein